MTQHHYPCNNTVYLKTAYFVKCFLKNIFVVTGVYRLHRVARLHTHLVATLNQHIILRTIVPKSVDLPPFKALEFSLNACFISEIMV